jgi:hypothetical protein
MITASVLLAAHAGGFFNAFNTFIWIVSNILVFAIFVSAAIFGVAYPLLFKIETTGGWRIWRAILSIAGFGFLSVIGTFIDPQTTPWWALPPSVDWWRPVVRFVIFGVVAQSFISLVIYLLQRRFNSKRLVIRPEIAQLLSSDLSLYYGTGPGIPDHKNIATALVAAGWTKPGLLEPAPVTLGVQPRPLPHRRGRR